MSYKFNIGNNNFSLYISCLAGNIIFKNIAFFSKLQKCHSSKSSVVKQRLFIHGNEKAIKKVYGIQNDSTQ